MQLLEQKLRLICALAVVIAGSAGCGTAHFEARVGSWVDGGSGASLVLSVDGGVEFAEFPWRSSGFDSAHPRRL